MSDDQLQDIAFKIYVKRAAVLSTGAHTISDPVVEQVKYAVQVLWMLLKKSGHSLRRKFARYVSYESQLITFSLKAMCTCLESKGTNITVIQLHSV